MKVTHVRAKVHPVHPVHPVVHRSPNVKSKPKTHLPPAPFDVKPPQGNGGGNGNGHGK